MSIHPEHAFAILNGSKLVEFRKRPLAKDVTYVFIYATRPISAIVGAFSVRQQRTMFLDQLWGLFADSGGIDRNTFSRYYQNRDVGTGIEIGDVYEARNKLSLQESFRIARPPQSFQYVDQMVALSIIRGFLSIKTEPTSENDVTAAMPAKTPASD